MTVSNRRRRGIALASLLATAALVASCSSDTGSGGVTDTETAAARIVSLSPSATETLFAVGAGDRVVAVDDQSDYPEDAPKTALSGYTPNLEAILGYTPDLVVSNELAPDVVSGLERAGVTVLDQPAPSTVAEAYAQIEKIGVSVGEGDAAAELVDEMTTRIDKAVLAAPQADGLTYYHELDQTFFTAAGDTFIGHVYGLFGLKNIAGADIGGVTYPQLQSEQIITDNPDLIFLADNQCCGVTPEAVAKRAGWDQITAVREGRVYVLDEDIASRWGPRLADLVEQLSGLLATLPATQPAPVG
ncbi:ABC transporter substrate-binding protein [Gordonia alkaliphila]|uniref:ABC transporter substrate-binding protein n=1 Tax=Gordonia alkaliphila TaxID=1053547 RepID=A0ABP8Z9B5_9ACTN|nr:ABC transporter substrate-binding protein [Gordonia alkaliphila]MCK0440807.1 ABC transporter substrate-binding protein [Gordonia alkaliphila]